MELYRELKINGINKNILLGMTEMNGDFPWRGWK